MTHGSASTPAVDDCLAMMHTAMAAITQASHPEWLTLDITMSHFKAIMALYALGPLHVGELGRRLGLSEPAASLLVDRLEQRHLAERRRDEQDRRRCLVALLPTAVDLATRLHEGRAEHMRRWLATMTEGELAALHYGLRGLSRVVADSSGT